MPEARPRRSAPAVRSSVLFCEVCGEETPHRILRFAAEGSGTVSGTARCGQCRWTHAFRQEVPSARPVWVVRSDGERSTRERRDVPGESVVEVGARLPGLEAKETVRKIELHDGRTPTVARPVEIATVWTAVERHDIPVSLITGRETVPVRWTPLPGAIITVGDPLTVDGSSTFVVGFRGRGRSWRRSGDALPAEEVTRIYARRIANPPAGRSRWSSSNAMPSSRASSRSRPLRVRSSSGTR